jgi:hypothetical protein
MQFWRFHLLLFTTGLTLELKIVGGKQALLSRR